jgi:hypothetical protein
MGVEDKGKVMEGDEWTKVKHTHSGHTLRHCLNINLNISNENQNCKTGGGGVINKRERVKEGD